MPMTDGLLLIDKPLGLRSTDCVARVKRFMGRGVRVGHAGTLDSTASGLLIVLLGAATRLSDYVMSLPKRYEAVVKLGAATDTCDASGQILFERKTSLVDAFLFDKVLCSFWGTRMQRPPEISALKINGTPSHRLARSGSAQAPSARSVFMPSVRRISPLTMESDEKTSARIAVTCGKGTYVRSIARDIGERLGCGAHIADLRRTAIGPFEVDAAVAPKCLECGDKDDFLKRNLRSPREVGGAFHRILLTEDAERLLLSGLGVPLADAGRYAPGTVDLKSGLCVEGERMIGFVDLLKGDAGVFLRSRANILCRTVGDETAVRG